MGKWKIVLSAAVLTAAVAPAAHADDFTKLTLLTFSGPVDVPGITLPAGTYRFQLADPSSGRRVVKVSDKDGTKTYGMFLSIPNQRMTPSNTPVVMFKETAAGAPPAVQVWFYPGETYGYEFAYPHAQALRIARASHQSVLAYNDRSTASSSEADRMASMRGVDSGADRRERQAGVDGRNVEGVECSRAARLRPAGPRRRRPSRPRPSPPDDLPPDVICHGTASAAAVARVVEHAFARDRLGGPHGARSGVVMRGNVPLT